MATHLPNKLKKSELAFIVMMVVVHSGPVMSKPSAQYPNPLYQVGAFRPDGNISLRHLAVNPENGDVFIGAVNYIYNLDTNLKLKTSAQTGPELDNNACFPPIPDSTPCRHPKKMTDNFNKVLLVDNEHHRLIACGTIYHGYCERRDLANVQIRDTPYYHRSVVNSNASATTVAFIAPGPFNKSSLYVSVTHSGSTQGVIEIIPAFASRDIINFSLSHTGIFSYTAFNMEVQVKELFPIYYIYGFGSEGFSYTMAVQKKEREGREFHSVIFRVCQNDPHFYSYVEVSLSCTLGGTSYNILQAAAVGKASVPLASQLGIDPSRDVLYGVFAVAEPFSAKPMAKSAMCLFPMQYVRKVFTENIQRCFQGFGQSGGGHMGTSINCLVNVEFPIEDDYCGDVDVNQPLQGTIPIESRAVLEFPSATDVITSLLVTVVNDYTVAFVGTKDGSIVKVSLKSLASANVYQTVPVVPGTPILPDLKFDKPQTSLFVLTSSKVIKMKVTDCSQFLTCVSCSSSIDPYCAWCAVQNGKVDVVASLQATPNPITMPSVDDDNGDISTIVTLCLNFTIHESRQERLDFTAELEIDSQIAEKTSRRAVFVKPDGNVTYRLIHNFEDVRNCPTCVDYKAQFKKKQFLGNSFIPVEVAAKYRLDETSGSSHVPDLNERKNESVVVTEDKPRHRSVTVFLLVRPIVNITPKKFTSVVFENIAIGSRLKKFNFSDDTMNGLVLLPNIDLTLNPPVPFTLTRDGYLTVSSPLDFETRESYEFTITVTEPNTRLTSFADVTIDVLDINDNAPVFDFEKGHTIFVEERNYTSADRIIFKVKAKDNDGTTDNNRVTFKLTKVDPQLGDAAFRITTHGDLVVCGSVTAPTFYNVSVDAADNGNPQLRSETVIGIRITSAGGGPNMELMATIAATVIGIVVLGAVLLACYCVLKRARGDGGPRPEHVYLHPTDVIRQNEYHASSPANRPVHLSTESLERERENSNVYDELVEFEMEAMAKSYQDETPTSTTEENHVTLTNVVPGMSVPKEGHRERVDLRPDIGTRETESATILTNHLVHFGSESPERRSVGQYESLYDYAGHRDSATLAADNKSHRYVTLKTVFVENPTLNNGNVVLSAPVPNDAEPKPDDLNPMNSCREAESATTLTNPADRSCTETFESDSKNLKERLHVYAEPDKSAEEAIDSVRPASYLQPIGFIYPGTPENVSDEHPQNFT